MARKDANPGAKERKAERQRQAMNFRMASMDYRDIAARLGVSVSTAFKDVKDALEEARHKTGETAEDMIEMESQRLNMARLSIATKVAKGELGAVDRWVIISESFRRLHGLDKPKKISPTSPDGEQEFGAADVFDFSDLTEGELAELEPFLAVLQKIRQRRVDGVG